MAEGEKKTPLEEAFEQIDEVCPPHFPLAPPCAPEPRGRLLPLQGTADNRGSPPNYCGLRRMAAVRSTERRSARWWKWPARLSPKRSWTTR